MSFKQFNPNPKYSTSLSQHLGDCTVRAICAVTGMSWVDTYNFMSTSSLKVYAPFSSPIGFAQIMKELGFRLAQYDRNTEKTTIAVLASKYPNNTIIACAFNHIVCCKNGDYYDSWDSGNCKVTRYWIK